MFAYVIPFSEGKKSNTGFITLGAHKNADVFYHLSEDLDLLKEIVESSMETQSKETFLCYLPPMSYFVSDVQNSIRIEAINEENSSVVNVPDASIDENISNIISEKNDLTSYYNSFYSDDNKVKNSNLIENVKRSSFGKVVRYGHSDTVYLNKWDNGDFVPVDGRYYGGNQYWWPDSDSRSSNGCGPVAAANITAYLADKNDSKYGNLYSLMNFDYDNFMTHQALVYDALNPSAIGLLSVKTFGNRVKDFASNRGVTLSYSYIGGMTSLNNSIDFIRQGMIKDSPVAVLNLQKFGYDYGWHWMTITGYRYVAEDSHSVYVSNKKSRELISLNALNNAIFYWGGGYVYFE